MSTSKKVAGVFALTILFALARPALGQNLTAGQLRLLPTSPSAGCPASRACVFGNSSGSPIRVSFIDSAGGVLDAGTAARARSVSAAPAGYVSGDLWYDTAAKRFYVVQDGVPTPLATPTAPIFSGTITGTYALGGSPSLAANLAAAGYSITGAGTVSATQFVGSGALLTSLPGSAITGAIPLGSVPAHASTHQPGGADPLPTAAAADTSTANGAGVSTSFARADHVHRDVILQTAEAHATADFSTAAGPVLITGTAVTITKQASTKVLVNCSFAASNTTVTAVTEVALFVDGVVDFGAAQTTAVVNATQGGAITRLLSGLAAGAHTFDLRMTAGAGTASVRAGTLPTQEHASCVVIETRL